MADLQPPLLIPLEGAEPTARCPLPRPPVLGGTAYFKRYKMEADVANLPAPSSPPPGFALLAWAPSLCETHASVLYQCFRQEIDAIVFASLGDAVGCRALMDELVSRSGFVPQATWLLTGPDGPCGTI